MSSPTKPRVQRQRDQFEQRNSTSPTKIDFDNDSDLLPPPTRYRHHRNSGSGSISSTSTGTGTPDRERGPTTAYPNYYDYSENDPPNLAQNNAMANMAMQVPLQQPQGQGRLVDSSRAQQQQQQPVTTAQLAAAARSAAAAGGNNGRGGSSRPPSYTGSQQHAQRSPEDSAGFPPNKVDLDAARYRQTQQRRPRDPPQQPGAKERPPTNGSSGGVRPGSSGTGNPNFKPAALNTSSNNNNNNNPPNNSSPESPSWLSPTAAANIQRLPTPSLANTVLQPLDAKVTEYGVLMAEAQGEMARLDDEMRQLQERQREAEQRFLESKSRHDEYRRQYQDVERALRGGEPLNNGGGGGMGLGLGPGVRRPDGGPPGGPPPGVGGLGPQQGVHPGQQFDNRGDLDRDRGFPGPGGHRPAMASQRTVSAHSEQPSMMSQESIRTQKKGRFSRIFGV
ncbi:hypothetical protein VPNG_09926 [Cytospora leucostoma]|uniref:Uncharacterized protein n=1 Tax=Cytospora leucostoma TaxID=1230097 RepID=A0A423VJB1_9PEZI|nr:hypothetical protein VPNG_09926 [Cytospora leucostoma]